MNENSENYLKGEIPDAEYRLLFEKTDQGFCIIEKIPTNPGAPSDYRYLAANHAFELHTGLASVVGKTIQQVVPNVENSFLERYDSVVASGEAEHFVDYITQLGLWVEVDVFATTTPGRLAIIFNDITRQREAEERQAFLLNLSDALRSVSDPVQAQQVTTRLAMDYFNSDRCYFCEIVDGRANIYRDAARDGLVSVSGSYQLDEMPIFKAVIDAGKAFIVENITETDMVDESLRELCIQLDVISFLDIPVIKNGIPVGILCIVQGAPRQWTEAETYVAGDVAERCWDAVQRSYADAQIQELNQNLEQQVAERTAELRESNEFLEGIVDSSLDMIQVFKAIRDADGKIIDFIWLLKNKISEHIYGDVGNRSLLENNPGVVDEGIFNSFVEVIETGIPQRYEKHYVHEQFDGWFYQSVVKMDDGVATTTADITARKEAELEVMRLYRELSEKNAELESLNTELQTFTGIAANDYKETLHKIYVGFEHVLKVEGPKLSDTSKAALRRSQSAIQKLKLLTDDIIGYSSLSADNEVMAQVDLGKTLSRVMEDLSTRIEAKQAEIRLVEPLPVIKGYPLLLNLLLRHLIDNALKFSVSETRPEIEIEYSVVNDSKREGVMYHRIGISDNGIGFDQKYAKDIFAAFYKLHPHYRGAGIGLAVCRKIMAMHGGFMRVKSKEGQGSHFCCYFPLEDR